MPHSPGDDDVSQESLPEDADDLFAEDEPGIAQEGAEGETRRSTAPGTSAAAIALRQAQEHVGQRGARLTLVMGEVAAGKSTLLVELWTEFMLRGRVGDFTCAGSLTALAFEQRCFLSRNQSGARSATTLRTRSEDDGWLHLRTRHPEFGLTDVLVSDMTGERFERVRQGRELLEEFPFTGRVDLFLVLIDGSAFADREMRETTENYAGRLLDSLARSPALDPQAQVCVVLTKVDVLNDADLVAYEAVEASLLHRARRADAHAQAIRMAARPNGQEQPLGLEAVIALISARPSASLGHTASEAVTPARAFGRYTR